jgi:hydrogenase-4 component E
MNPLDDPRLGERVINLMAAMVLVLQIGMVGQRWLVTNIRIFAAQSFLLAAIAATIAYFNSAPHIYIAAALTLAVKGIALPILLERLVANVGIRQEIEPIVNVPASILISAGLTLLGYLVAESFYHPGAPGTAGTLGQNTLAVAISLFLIGFFMIVNRRKAITQVLALLSLEEWPFPGGNRVDLWDAARDRAGRVLRSAGRYDDALDSGVSHPGNLRFNGCQQAAEVEGLAGHSMILVAILVTPVLAAALALAASRRVAMEAINLTAAVVTFVLAAILAGQVLEWGTVSAWGGLLYADALSALVMLLTGFVYVACATYAIGYFRHDEKNRISGNLRKYYTLTPLFVFPWRWSFYRTTWVSCGWPSKVQPLPRYFW